VGEGRLPGLVAELREAGLHTRFTYKTTRNVGKLLKEAAGARARYAVILDHQAGGEQCSLKDLDTGDQTDAVPLSELTSRVSSA